MRKFIPLEGYALSKSAYDASVHRGYYLHDYIKMEKLVEAGQWDRESAYRTLILNDLFFLFYFVIGTPDEVGGHHAFTVDRCNELQEGPVDKTLDVWARGHLKSSIITIAETIQYMVGNPEHCTCILSYKASVAKDKFLGSIMAILESNATLKACFPDVLYEEPRKEAQRWSLDGGLYFKRKTKRGEPSIMAGGLIEGMPTGLHFERRVYDDVVTEDIGNSVAVMEDVKKKFDSSQNLKMIVGESHHRVIGTFYHYLDPLVYIKDKKDINTGKNMYQLRLYPATEDGQPSGKPVFMTQKALDEMKGDKTFNCQQLCNPVPTEDVTLKPEYLEEVKPQDIPSGCYTFLVVDQAGDAEFNVSEGDDWAILTAKVKPVMTDVGVSDIYITDIISENFGASEGIDIIVQKYINAGMVMVLGIEKAGMSSTHTQVREALRGRGRFLTIENDIKKKRNSVILLLRPERRNKKKFIDTALEWPLNNGKIHISTDVPVKYREKLEREMVQHPYGRDDILNTLAYLYRDMILNYNFPMYLEQVAPEPIAEEAMI